MLPRPASSRESWPDVRLAITQTLDSYPAAKEALIKALESDRQPRSWPELRDFILTALRPFPDAMEGVSMALKEVNPLED